MRTSKPRLSQYFNRISVPHYSPRAFDEGFTSPCSPHSQPHPELVLLLLFLAAIWKLLGLFFLSFVPPFSPLSFLLFFLDFVGLGIFLKDHVRAGCPPAPPKPWPAVKGTFTPIFLALSPLYSYEALIDYCP